MVTTEVSASGYGASVFHVTTHLAVRLNNLPCTPMTYQRDNYSRKFCHYLAIF